MFRRCRALITFLLLLVCMTLFAPAALASGFPAESATIELGNPYEIEFVPGYWSENWRPYVRIKVFGPDQSLVMTEKLKYANMHETVRTAFFPMEKGTYTIEGYCFFFDFGGHETRTTAVSVLKLHVIVRKDIGEVTVLPVSDQVYIGSEILPELTVTDGEEQLTENEDYTVSFENNINAGEATAVLTGMGTYFNTKTVTFSIVPKSIKEASIGKIGDQVYTGTKITPAVTVKDGEKTLAEGTDYKAAYKNSKYPGIATVTVTGRGNYTGKKTASFRINPKPTVLTSLSSKAGTVTAKWKKGTKITGYQIQYGVKKSFEGARKVIVPDRLTLSRTFKKLTPGKTCYVRIRTYASVDGKRFWSAWSDAMKIKIR